MSKYEKLAKDIVRLVGEKNNISSLTHCVTRLRFKLKDESKADDDAIKNLDGVVTVMHSAGQYQVVIGNHVPFVYEDVCHVAGISANSQAEDDAPKGVFNKLIDIISGCFSPILGPMCAAGIIKGLNALFVFLLGNSYATSGTYITLNAIGDAVFYFMPVLLGYSSAKKFNLNPIVGMLIGASLCYPTIQKDTIAAAGKAIGSLPYLGSYYTKFVGIPLIAANYTSTVVPVILITALASKIQKIAKKVVPEMLQNFFVPFFVLLISLPIGFLVIGPVVSLLTNLLSTGFTHLFAFSPVVAGLILGAIWQVLVIFGLHWALVPLAMLNMTQLGADTILASVFPASFAQTAALIAMYFKLKDKNKKSLAIPSIVSGICGVTEPSIYGYTLPARTPFIASCIGAGVGGAIIGVLKTKVYIMGGLGIFGFVNAISPKGDASSMFSLIIATAIAMVIGFIVTMLIYTDNSEVNTNENTKLEVKNSTIYSPIKGTTVKLSEVSDAAFSQGAMGQGIAIIPTEGKIVAPANGHISVLFPTLHAIGITCDTGEELLLHVGMNTVELEGKPFTAHIKQGDYVKQGQLLLDVDLDMIKQAGLSLETPIIVTNANDFLDIIPTDKKQVNKEETLLSIIH